MRCPKCNKKNITNSNYCINCKHKFSDEEKEKYYNKTFYHFIDVVSEWYERITFQTITDNIIFKIVSLLVVLVIGIYFWKLKGIDTRLLKSNDYSVYYNEKVDSYYLLIDDNVTSTDIKLYKPNRLKELKIKRYDLDNKIINETIYDEESDLILTPFDNDYYVLESTYSNNKTSDLRLYLYHKSDIDLQGK